MHHAPDPDHAGRSVRRTDERQPFVVCATSARTDDPPIGQHWPARARQLHSCVHDQCRPFCIEPISQPSHSKELETSSFQVDPSLSPPKDQPGAVLPESSNRGSPGHARRQPRRAARNDAHSVAAVSVAAPRTGLSVTRPPPDCPSGEIEPSSPGLDDEQYGDSGIVFAARWWVWPW